MENSKKVRLPILISFGEKEQLLAIPKLESSSGQDQAKTVSDALYDWKFDDNKCTINVLWHNCVYYRAMEMVLCTFGKETRQRFYIFCFFMNWVRNVCLKQKVHILQIALLSQLSSNLEKTINPKMFVIRASNRRIVDIWYQRTAKTIVRDDYP